MHFLIGLLAALSVCLFFTFKWFRREQTRKFAWLLIIIDAWLLVVLGYLLVTAIAS